MTARRPDFLDRTAIVGVGQTPLVRRTEKTVLALAIEACRAAIEDAGAEPSDVDGITSFSFLGDSVPGHAVATGLAIPRLSYVSDITMGGQAPCLLVMQAAMAVASGVATHVLVYRALRGRSGTRIGSAANPGVGGQYRYPLGFNAYPQFVAMWARRYMIETGATEDDLAGVVMSQRKHAARNEHALYREPLTIDAYRASPYVAEPFRVPDCAAEVDGASAVLVTSLDRARQLRHPPVVLRAAAYLRGPRTGFDTGDTVLWEDYSRNYTTGLSRDLWAMAGMRPQDVDVAELYDCFSSSVLFALEGLGIAERGGAGAFVRSGATAPDGALPVNTGGGLLSEGYVHGMNTLTEAVRQVQGRAGAHQVADVETCVVTSGALMDGSALILGRA